MPSVLAIVSKAVFEKLAPKGVAVGDVIDTDRYVSGHAAFAQIGTGDAIFLVTVRPPSEALWLVAVLERVKHKIGTWIGAANARSITDITPLVKKLKFSTGSGITAKKGALGMSLQTPRVLTPDDVALLRGGKASPAVAEYRSQVDATPAAAKARAQAAAAAQGGEVLRLVDHRRPFEMLDQLRAPQQKQVAKLTRQNRAGKPAELVDHEDWAPMELVDVLDLATGAVSHQLYIWPWGSGELFVHDTTKRAAMIIQHGFEQGVYDLPFRTALAAAYALAKPQLAETVDFQLDKGPPPSPGQEELDERREAAAAYAQLAKALGKSKERFRVYETLTKAQQKTIRHVFATTVVELIANYHDLSELGLPPTVRLRSWCGHSPASELEKLAGKWPVWKWLKEASTGKVKHAVVIAAVAKALRPAARLELCRMVCTDAYDYDLWGESVKYDRGESVANKHQANMIRLFAAIVDGAGDDAALAFAATAQQVLKKDAECWLAAIATFALAARARRRHEPFPAKLVKLATEADFLGHGAHLNEAIREVVETMAPRDRERFLISDDGPYFTTSYNEDLKGGKKIEVPCVLHAWHLVDLAPTDKIVKAMVDSIFRWDRDRKPTERVLDIIAKVGAPALPHLKRAVKKRSPYKHVLERALKRVEPTTR